MKLFTLVLTLVIWQVSCSSEDETNIVSVQVEPLVTANTPSGFLSTGLVTMAVPSELTTIKEKIFSGSREVTGGTCTGDVQCTLMPADSRMEELKSRAQDHRVPCIESGDAYEVSLGTNVLPNGQSFTTQINCRENIGGDNDIWIGFGNSGDDFFLVERQTGTNSIGGFWSKTNRATEDVELVEIAPGEDSSDMLLKWIKSNRDAGTFEMTVASSGPSGTGLGCGIRMMANSNYLYAQGVFSDPGAAPNSSCDLEGNQDTSSGTVGDGAFTSICVNASTLEEATSSECEAAGLTTFTLPYYTNSDISGRVTELKNAYSSSSDLESAATFTLEGLDEGPF